MQPFFKKYQPKNSSEIIGQNLSVRDLRNFITDFKKQKKNACIVHGPIGCGKTSSVHALANELDYEILEVNASDFRNKAKIDEVIKPASQQMSLFGKNKIILIDEIDGLSGRKDRGGVSAITALIKDSKHPLILTSNNPWNRKFSGLRKKCEVIGFNELAVEDIQRYLVDICKKENIKFSETDLKTLARRSAGDLRGALIDLQTLITYDDINKQSIDNLGYRKRTDSIKQALKIIFKTTDFNIAIGALQNVDEDLNTSMAWIDANLPKEYKDPEDLYRAYEKLSKADIFERRIRRWQHWRYLVYINALLTAGVALSKKKRYDSFFQYEESKRFLKIWILNRKNAKKKAIAEKIAKKTHQSTKEAVKEMAFYKEILKNNITQYKKKFDLNRDEVEWLNA